MAHAPGLVRQTCLGCPYLRRGRLGVLLCDYGGRQRQVFPEDLMADCGHQLTYGTSRPWTTGELARAEELRRKGGRRWLDKAAMELLRTPRAIRVQLAKHFGAHEPYRKWPRQVKRQAATLHQAQQEAQAACQEFRRKHGLSRGRFKYLAHAERPK